MTRRRTAIAAVLAVVAAALAGCSSSGEAAETPQLAAPGTVLTTVKPVRQDITNSISLAGKVTIDPVFGIVAPIGGEVRYVDRQPSETPVDEPTWVASIWKSGLPSRVEIPKGSTLAGRLMADHATVTAGMPIISAKQSGYGIVAEIDSAQAYRLSGAAQSVKGQIKNGPGPFACKPLGTVAALPAGTIPEPPPPSPAPSAQPDANKIPDPEAPVAGGSEPTGLRLVCTAPRQVKLINGAEVTLDVVTGKASKVWVLPVEAVAGTTGKGKIDLVGDDQTRRTVDVTLGLTDGRFIEIKAGIKGDETVAVPAPDIPAAEPKPGDGGGASGPVG